MFRPTNLRPHFGHAHSWRSRGTCEFLPELRSKGEGGAIGERSGGAGQQEQLPPLRAPEQTSHSGAGRSAGVLHRYAARHDNRPSENAACAGERQLSWVQVFRDQSAHFQSESVRGIPAPWSNDLSRKRAVKTLNS
jgi:hypothetical protein